MIRHIDVLFHVQKYTDDNIVFNTVSKSVHVGPPVGEKVSLASFSNQSTIKLCTASAFDLSHGTMKSHHLELQNNKMMRYDKFG